MDGHAAAHATLAQQAVRAYTGYIDSASTQFGPSTIDTDKLVLIVTGAHLRSEVGDRPLAYALRSEILRRIEQATEPALRDLTPVVCSDVWRLNDEDLAACPTVSIGGPGVNALSAYLADKLASVFVIEDRLMVQADLEYDDLSACCWGMAHDTTVQAVQVFIDRYLDGFLEAAADAAAG